jgi:alpha-tubulin suppressor-like RCC1 family protein
MKSRMIHHFQIGLFSFTVLWNLNDARAMSMVSWGDAGLTNPCADNVVAVASGYKQTVLLKDDGTVANCGMHWEPPQSLPGTWDYPIVVPVGLTGVVAVAGGYAHSLALKSDGTVIAWGRNTYGQTNVPTDLTNVVAISASENHSLALKADGTVVRWGTSPASVPAGLTNVVAIEAGTDDLALRGDGTVTGWGANPNWPNFLSGLSNIVAISSGWSMGGSWCDWLALTADGTVLGYYVPAGLTNIVAICASSGTDHHINLAIRADGTVTGWGFNFFGGPIVPLGLTNVSAVSSDSSHCVALIGDVPPIRHASITNATLTEEGFSMFVPSQNGRVYRLEYKTDMTTGEWTPLPLVAGNGGLLKLADVTGGGSQRFYRVQRW